MKVFLYAVCLLLTQRAIAMPQLASVDNVEFLFNGGLQIRDDKTWCLNKAIYRMPVEGKVAMEGRLLQIEIDGETINEPRTCNLTSIPVSQRNREEQEQVEKENIAIDTAKMGLVNQITQADFQYLAIDDDIAQSLVNDCGIKYRRLLVTNGYRKKFIEAIKNTIIAHVNMNGDNPDIRHPEFIDQVDQSLEQVMSDEKAKIDSRHFKEAVRDQWCVDTILAIILRTNEISSIFQKNKQNKVRNAWNVLYPGQRNACANASPTDNTVHDYYEKLKDRIENTVEAPSEDIAQILPPVTVTTSSPPLYVPSETYEETVVPKCPNFSVKQPPKYNNIKPAYGSGTNKKVLPDFPTPYSEQPKHTEPQCPNLAQFPSKKDTPKKMVPNDKIFIAEFPEIQRTINIRRALTSFAVLTPALKEDIVKCKLSLTGAFSRCHKIHGAGKCATITPTYVGPRCPDNTERVGCCSCMAKCPAGFKEGKILCKKPKNYLLSPRATPERCYLSNAVKCEKVGQVWTPACREGFQRVGTAICVASCPSHLKEFGDSCLKQDKIDLGDVFSWAEGDE